MLRPDEELGSDASFKYPREVLTKGEARRRHPDAYILIAGVNDEEGDCRDAIFVWRSFELSDKEDPVAHYWLTDPQPD